MIDILIYFKIFLYCLILLITGLIIIKRATKDNRAQILLPVGLLFGITFHIFVINLLAHVIKGPPVIYFSLLIQIIFTVIVHFRIPTFRTEFPKGSEKYLWIISLTIWIIFSYQIAAHSIIDGADSTVYYTLTSRFIRGDYPIYQPWQPAYIIFYHIGGLELLASLKVFTGASYYFIHAFISFILLICISQVLTYIFLKDRLNNFKRFITSFIPPIFGLISIGNIMFVWPINFSINFENGLINWLKNLPTLTRSFEHYGTFGEVDTLIYFLHHSLGLSLFLAALIPLLSPNNKRWVIFVLTIFIAAIALINESIFILSLPAIIIASYLITFKKFAKYVLILIVISLPLVLFQGGIVTESILNRYGIKFLLIFPSDGEYLYRTYRLNQSSNKFFSDEQYNPLAWFHPAIYIQLLILLISAFVYSKSRNHENFQDKILIWILLICAITSLVAYFGLVPKGYTNPNGNRFLTWSFYFSGLGIAFLIVYFLNFIKFKITIFKILLNYLIIWILITSITPIFVNLFPRKKENFLITTKPNINLVYEWIKKNIAYDKDVISLIYTNPVSISNLELAREAGVLTPIWPSKPFVFGLYDTGPDFFDFYYTLNPETFKILGVDYIITSREYRTNLPKIRQNDLQNPYYFKPMHQFSGYILFGYPFEIPSNIIIYQVLNKYLIEAQNLEGTFSELNRIAPLEGKYYIDYPPNITENIFRALRLLLIDRQLYSKPGGAFYNGLIDVEPKQYGKFSDWYNYLVLGETVDPKTICSCEAKLIWSGLGNGVKLWKTYRN